MSKIIFATSMMLSAMHAPERFELTGFENLKFGMSTEELRTTTQVSAPRPEGDGFRLDGTTPLVVKGIPYKASFLFTGGELDSVNLINVQDMAPDMCSAKFTKMRTALALEYGAPDWRTFGKGIASTNFTFSNEGRLDALSYYANGSCTVSVTYARPEARIAFAHLEPHRAFRTNWVRKAPLGVVVKQRPQRIPPAYVAAGIPFSP